MIARSARAREPAELIATVVMRIPGVRPHPLPRDLVLLIERMQLLVKIGVGNGNSDLAAKPAVRLPGLEFRYVLEEDAAIRVQRDREDFVALERLQRFDRGLELHAVAIGITHATRSFGDHLALTQKQIGPRAPSFFLAAIGVDFDRVHRLSVHGLG